MWRTLSMGSEPRFCTFPLMLRKTPRELTAEPFSLQLGPTP
jgi:hypothetical protein